MGASVSSWTEDDLREWIERQNPKGNAAPLATTDARCEADIQQECVKLMEEDGWRSLRTSPVSDRSRGVGFGEIGMADYLFIRYQNSGYGLPSRKWEDHDARVNALHIASWVQVLWIEFKSRSGKVGAHQAEWHRNERARGAFTWIASVDFPASVEGFREHYATSGLMRRSKWW